MEFAVDAEPGTPADAPTEEKPIDPVVVVNNLLNTDAVDVVIIHQLTEYDMPLADARALFELYSAAIDAESLSYDGFTHADFVRAAPALVKLIRLFLAAGQLSGSPVHDVLHEYADQLTSEFAQVITMHPDS
ncbi:MAG TPA: hypothetical protein VLF67_02205 [Candidatus Saccharimonas sp.]|nr:hypothetical protein [Candidatus Saccharimonas sp.]